MKLLITEEALQLASGHWSFYIGDIALFCRSVGDSVDVLTHRDAVPDVVARVGGIPTYSNNCWIDTRGKRRLNMLRHSYAYLRETMFHLRAGGPFDVVLAPTMRIHQLLAIAIITHYRSVPPSTRFVLLFVQGFGRYVGPGLPTTFPKTLSNHLARFCFRLLAPAVRSDRVVLAAETLGMQDELQRFTGLPVSLFPHPVPPPEESGDEGQETGDRKQETGDRDQASRTKGDGPSTTHKQQDTKHQEQSTKHAPQAQNQAQSTRHKAQITITCPGFARHEKGNDLLQEAILEILAGPEGDRFHFIMQWPEPFVMPDGRQLGPDPRLLADPRVEFLNHSLDAVAYEALLARSDLVILPYRRRSYHHRVSRVAIEAASRGIPLIYTSGTWTAEIAELAGGGVEILEETAEAVCSAIEQGSREFGQLSHTANLGAIKAVEYHSARRFRSLLSVTEPLTNSQ